MDRVERARRYAQLAYAAAVAEIVQDYDRKRHEVRARHSKRTDPLPIRGSESEEDELNREQLVATVKAQVNVLFDGCELSGVPINDEVVASIFNQATKTFNSAAGSDLAIATEPRALGRLLQLCIMRQKMGDSRKWIQAEIDRRRSQYKSAAQAFPSYHIDDDIPPAVIAADNSVSAVLNRSNELFSTMVYKIEACLVDGGEKAVIIERLAALRRTSDVESLTQRYREFMAAAADHIFLFAPFLPALMETIERALNCDHRLRA